MVFLVIPRMISGSSPAIDKLEKAILRTDGCPLRGQPDTSQYKRDWIIDCDVHQGNGTAAILKNDPSIFTFSIHGKNNFPFHKEKSDLDVELTDGTDDAAYLEALDKGIIRSLENFTADLVIYLAGADPYLDDRFGRLAVTKEGLAQRDHLVLHHLYKACLPVAVTMAGGYARNVQDTVDINFQTILSALQIKKLISEKRE